MSLLCCVFSVFAVSALSAQELTSVFTTAPPVVDGSGDDSSWATTPVLSTHDSLANIPIELQSVHTSSDIFIKVRFPDSTENRYHKTLNWDKSSKTYRTGTLREDSFVLKWSMEPAPVDLSLHSENEYRADIWFWKAFRTDPVGYADDKMHIYSSAKGKKSQDIILENDKVMFLVRPSDSGRSTYKSIMYEKYIGDSVPRYKHQEPTGSRSDIKAKGSWQNGFWTIEFQRKLVTGNDDDVQFNTRMSSRFGVSRYEIAGKAKNEKLEQPNYESGDITENLELVFKQ